MNKLLFLVAFISFQNAYNMDAQVKKDETDSAMNKEYRKTRDAMNSTGKFKSTFKIKADDVPKMEADGTPKMEADGTPKIETDGTPKMETNSIPKSEAIVSIKKETDGTATMPVDSTPQKQILRLKDGIAMRDGKMVSIKDDIVTPMNYNITLANGTHVTVKGVCELKNGKKIKMDDGDFIDYYGVYVPLKQL